MRILVFGQSGQVARALAERLPQGCEATFLGRDKADLGNPSTCAEAIATHACDAVINAAAWTAVDRAETEEAAAQVINADSPAAMASACLKRDIPFLHISTDYVFDGQGTSPFRPTDTAAPVNAYGRTKLAGEIAIRASGARHLILRTSWVFSAHGQNFLRTMLRLGAERDHLRIVGDQIGGPTPATAIADALLKAASGMLGGAEGGIHHFSGGPDTSWANFARKIMASAGLPCRIEEIPSASYPTAAARPLNSRLDCRELEQAFGIPRPDWHAAMSKIVKELSA